MERREFLKLVPATALGAAGLVATRSDAEGESNSGARAPRQASTAGKKREMPDYAGKLGYSDMTSFDADGKPRPGFKHRSSKAQQADPRAPYKMPLTKEELGILNGSKGPEMAKVMAAAGLIPPLGRSGQNS